MSDLERVVVSDDEVVFKKEGKVYLRVMRCHEEDCPKEAQDAWYQFPQEHECPFQRQGGFMFLIFEDVLKDTERSRRFINRTVEDYERFIKKREGKKQLIV